MRALRFLNPAILLILAATSIGVYAQDEKPREEKPRQEDARPAARQDEMKAPKQDEAKPSKEEKREQKQDEKQQREQMKDNRQAHARPAGKSGHIPDDKFRAHFGHSHTFVVQRTTVSGGQSGFVYGGYTFVFVDPWPVEWVYTDDCYVDYIDGEYFLFDVLHPGIRVALFVVL